jgi:uncharacterized protein YyaL (SSP411 family)
MSIARFHHLAWILLAIACSERKGVNELASAASPYLREHADNPVHWVEWSDEALARAESENKPIVVSIGYASCHWCHVMERETFMDTAVARIMNRDFVCIKVDREERPDLDQVYIRAAEMLSGNAGWPLNAFALPDGRPFYAATYFPNAQWLSILQQVKQAYLDDYSTLENQAAAVQNNIAGEDKELFARAGKDTSRISTFLSTVPAWVVYLDMEHGGVSGPNRFPMPAVGEFLLQYHQLADDPVYLKWLTTTLDEMAFGGIYDQLIGGFSRYTVDSAWRIPHFEKMLYDNGQLVSLYAHAYQSTGNLLYRDIVHETLEFVSLELTSPEGAFYSSINADSDDEEGKFYVWSFEELKEILGEDADAFAEYYDVTQEGNWESGQNILSVTPSLRSDLARRWMHQGDRTLLLSKRYERVRPTRDEKILTSWNAIMLNGYIDAYKATGDPSYLTTALKNAAFVQQQLMKGDGRVFHSNVQGGNHIPGFLEDYAWSAKAFIHLYEVTFDLNWLVTARKVTDYALKEFDSEQSEMYYFSPGDLPNPVTRKTEVYDNVIPSSNSVFAEVLFLLGEYFQETSYEQAARAAVTSAATDDPSTGIYLANWARVAQMMQFQPFEVAIVGPDAIAEARKLQSKYLPAAIFMGGDAEDLPLLENKLVPGKTTFYVCRNRVCKLPTNDAAVALQQLGAK